MLFIVCQALVTCSDGITLAQWERVVRSLGGVVLAVVSLICA